MTWLKRTFAILLAVWFLSPVGEANASEKNYPITWFCRSLGTMEVLAKAPSVRAFYESIMLAIETGKCAAAMRGASFSILPIERIRDYTSSTGSNHTIVKGTLPLGGVVFTVAKSELADKIFGKGV